MKRDCLDVIECLLEDHDSLKAVLEKLRSNEIEVPRKKVIFKRFLPLFEAHTYGEEQTVFEQGFQRDELRPFVLEGLEEHEMSEVLLKRIKLSVDDEQWHARLKVFCETLEHHLEEEEEETFPAMRKIFSKEVRAELGSRYLEARNRHHLAPVLDLPKDISQSEPELALGQVS